jgi:hypothetical protein
VAAIAGGTRSSSARLRVIGAITTRFGSKSSPKLQGVRRGESARFLFIGAYPYVLTLLKMFPVVMRMHLPVVFMFFFVAFSMSAEVLMFLEEEWAIRPPPGSS